MLLDATRRYSMLLDATRRYTTWRLTALLDSGKQPCPRLPIPLRSNIPRSVFDFELFLRFLNTYLNYIILVCFGVSF
jgi:hypothetical protein